MSLRLLYCGVDTLEATFAGELDEEIVEALESAKVKAIARDEPMPFPLAGRELYMQPKAFGFYRFVLKDGCMQLRISTASSGVPPVSVRLLAPALATYGHEDLYSSACGVAASLGASIENTLSRIDLCADVHDLDFTDADFENLVCPASFRQIIKDGDGITYQLGKGDVVLRIYRKDAELKAHNKLSYSAVWEAAEGYAAGEPVWRVEVQLRGNALGQLSARSVRVAFDKLPALFAYGLSWCELRRGEDSNSTRRETDPRWVELSSSWGASAPQKRIRKKARIEAEERAAQRMYSALTTLAAYSARDDLLSTMQWGLWRCEALIKERGLDFARDTQAKRARVVSDGEVPF